MTVQSDRRRPPGGKSEAAESPSGTPHKSQVPLTLTVAGGKGGVGKTSIALNLALVLARQGHRTLLLDGDLELANINVMLGLYPQATLEDVIAGDKSLGDVLVPVRENLDLLPGASGVENCLDQPDARQRDFLKQLASLESGYDRVIIDTASGLRNHALHMIAAAHLAVVVVTPDPTSLTDAFSLLKVLQRRGYRRQPSVIVNMARGSSQARSIFQRFSIAVSRYLGLSCHYLGAIWRDESIAQSVVSQTPVATLPNTDPSSRQFWVLADMLSVRWSQGAPRSLGFARYWIRLLERKRQDRSRSNAGSALANAPGSNPHHVAAPPFEPSPATTLDNSWPGQFRNWLKTPDVSPVARYEVVNEWLSVLGESLDDDMIETLQTGLANMRWEALPDAQRRAAAAHFRQLADLVHPPEKPATAPASGERMSDREADERAHRYASDVFGSQDLLLTQLQQQPSGAPLSRILEQMRMTEEDFRRSGGRRGGSS